MKRIPITPELCAFPNLFHPLLKDACVYDSSCSPEARVFYVEKDGGYFLKRAEKGTLEKEAEMTRFYHQKKLGPEVLSYESGEQDWLLTQKIPGEDCTLPMYKDDPLRLCDKTAELLRMLHDTDTSGCPIQNRTADYLAHARENYRQQRYDLSLFPDNWGYATPKEAFRVLENEGHFLQSNTLLHGDYCLPNILLDNWRFSGFIDLGSGGVGDRHVDLFWGLWSLQFNLKTDTLRDRFLDAYGRQDVEEDLFRIVAAAEVFQ